jgi:hypothetical protein
VLPLNKGSVGSNLIRVNLPTSQAAVSLSLLRSAQARRTGHAQPAAYLAGARQSAVDTRTTGDAARLSISLSLSLILLLVSRRNEAPVGYLSLSSVTLHRQEPPGDTCITVNILQQCFALRLKEKIRKSPSNVFDNCCSLDIIYGYLLS